MIWQMQNQKAMKPIRFLRFFTYLRPNICKYLHILVMKPV